jgi:hypothetical protein
MRTEHAMWPLPLLAGLLPLAAAGIAYALAIRLGLAPECNPFVDGCVSISRAGRHGLPNILFRALVLPAAVLQALCWMLCPAWLRAQGAAPDRWHRAMPVLGVAAGVVLVVYGTFLGTEGEGYRWMRRYGVAFWFGLTCILTLVVSGQMRRCLQGAGRRGAQALFALCAAVPLIGLGRELVLPWWADAAARDAMENVTEWWAAFVFTVFFLALAAAWGRTGFVMAPGIRRG